jgi:hypothetical protein
MTIIQFMSWFIATPVLMIIIGITWIWIINGIVEAVEGLEN